MGVGGVRWNPDESIVIEALEKNDGKIRKTAQYLNVTHMTIYSYLNKHPAVKEVADALRNGYTNNLLDKAEDVFEFALDGKEEDLSNAIKSAIFVCNNLGRDRGYNHPNAALDGLRQSFELLNNSIEKNYYKDKKADEIIREADSCIHGEQRQDKPS